MRKKTLFAAVAVAVLAGGLFLALERDRMSTYLLDISGLRKTEALAQFPFVAPSPQPIISLKPQPSDESLHVEYPTVFHMGDQKGLLYAAYGDDRRWRIKMATNDGDGQWKRLGTLFDESKLEFTGDYAFPFVRQLPPDSPFRYEVFFSARPKQGIPYNMLWHSLSKDGLKWETPEKLFEDTLVLDPIVAQRNGRDVVIYTSNDGKQAVRMADLNGGDKTSIYHPIAGGLYTLGLFTVGGKQIVVIQGGAPKRVDWRAACFDEAGKLQPAAPLPIGSFPRYGDEWDTMKYGMYFDDDPQGDLTIYYNGITGLGAESGGQVGFSVVDRTALAALLQTEKCR